MKKVFGIVLGLTLLSTFALAPALAVVKPGAVLPALSLPDASGQSHHLAGLTRGKVALLVYWSISCQHCREEMPHLLDLAKKLAGNPFVLLLVNADGPAMAPAVRNYAQINSLPGPILMDIGPKDSQPFADAFDCIATPTILVLDKTGKLTHAQEVRANMKKLTAAIEAAF